jgi:hypothetical protein
MFKMTVMLERPMMTSSDGLEPITLALWVGRRQHMILLVLEEIRHVLRRCQHFGGLRAERVV